MRTLFLFMMVTLDGYFEGENHDISWHNAANEEFNDFAIAQTNTVSTLLFGHRTYDVMASWWPKEEAMKDDPIVAAQMNDTPKVVVSHQDFTPAWGPTTVVSTNVIEEITKLKNGEGKAIGLYGSNNLCVSLMEAGLVDEFRIMINPIAIGKGTPLFAGIKASQKLKLITTQNFDSGNVLLTYQPA